MNERIATLTINGTLQGIGTDPDQLDGLRNAIVELSAPLETEETATGPFVVRPQQLIAHTSDGVNSPAGEYSFTVHVPINGKNYEVHLQPTRQMPVKDDSGAITDMWVVGPKRLPENGIVVKIPPVKSPDSLPSISVPPIFYQRVSDTGAKFDAASAMALTQSADAIKRADAAAAKATGISDTLDRKLDPFFNAITDLKKSSQETSDGILQFSDFPLFNDPSGFGGGSGGFGDGNSGLSARARIRRETRNLMGFEPSSDQPKQYLNGLLSLYKPVDKGGYIDYQRQPRAYAVVSELGGVTGSAQANLMLTHQNFMSLIEAPLREVYPFDPQDADPILVEAYRKLIGNLYSLLGEEFGRKYGPRPAVIRNRFTALVGDSPSFDPGEVSGLLGEFRDQLSIDNDEVNGGQEERNYAAFRLLTTQTVSLWNYWDATAGDFGVKRFQPLVDEFRPTDIGGKSFGQLMIELQQRLAIVDNNVKTFRAYADSVNFIEGKRRGTIIYRDYGPLTLEDTLDWIQDEALRIIPIQVELGGATGIKQVIGPTVRTLIAIANGAPVEARPLPRVQRAFDQLNSSLTGLGSIVDVPNVDIPNDEAFQPGQRAKAAVSAD